MKNIKIGDLVRCNNPSSWANAARFGGGFRTGIVVGELHTDRLNRLFKVLWQNGNLDDGGIWDYNLKLLNE